MGRRDSRAGRGIEEFLRHYVLSILQERPATIQELGRVIQERSAENERFRPGSSLRVPLSELERIVVDLRKGGLLRRCGDGSLVSTEKGREVVEKVASMKDSVGNSKDEAATKLVSILLQDANRNPRDKRVLDVGTGEGYLAFRLADTGFRVLGIDSSEFDYSKNSIKRAREKAGERQDLEFRLCDVRSLQEGQAFDYVVSSQAVHCMKDQKGSICSMCRVLREGGLLLISDFLVGLKGFLVHGFHCFLGLTEEEWEEILPRCGCKGMTIHRLGDFCVVEARRPGRKR